MTITRRDFAAGSLALGILPLGLRAASAQAEAALVAAAKSESGGMLYTIIEPSVVQAFLAAFKAKYGIDVAFQRLGSSPLSQRFAAENEANNVGADVIATGDQAFLTIAAGRGWLAKPGDLPALGNLGKEIWDGTMATVAFNPESLAWNTSIVKSAPKSWEALLDPQYSGRVLIFDPRNSILGVKWYSVIRKTYGDDFLRKLAKNATLSPSVVPAMQQVAAGAAAMYAPAVHVVVASLKDKGAPVDEAFLEPATTGAVVAAVAAKAPRPNTAKLLLNFMMTVEGQAILNKDNFAPIPNVPGTRPLPRMSEVSNEAAQKERPEILNLLGIN